MNLEQLIQSICQVQQELVGAASRAVNLTLTLRNWLIGWHLAEYELKGEDRSRYGDGLFAEIAGRLSRQGLSNCNQRQLYRYRDFYQTYPEIVGTAFPQLKALLPVDYQAIKKVGTVSPKLHLPSSKLLRSLSYSHFELLLEIPHPLKRAFYHAKYLIEMPEEKAMQALMEHQLQAMAELPAKSTQAFSAVKSRKKHSAENQKP